jgi:site-specific DNA-methyltransferase (adenine-specific)
MQNISTEKQNGNLAKPLLPLVVGGLTITCEDNMELMARYPDNYFDLAIVDPPYGIEIMTAGGTPKHLGFKQYEKKNWDNAIPNENYFKELFRVSKNQIIWGANYFTQYLPSSMGWILWDKGQRISQSDGELAFSSFQKALRVFTLNRCAIKMEGAIHPTQKPYKLYKWLLEKYAKEGDKILDTHLGSGSIAIACHDYKFELTACELDEEYFEKAKQRIINHVAQQSLF